MSAGSSPRQDELRLLEDDSELDSSYETFKEDVSDTETGMRDARNHVCSRIFGNAPACAACVKTMPLAVSVIESTFRGVGQVVFANNPFTGLIIALALALADPTIAGFALLATFTATLFGFFVLEEEPHVQSRQGLFGYSALLVGCAIPTFSAPDTPPYSLILPVMLVAILSAMLFTSISRLLAPVKVPAMTLPFNLACLIWFSVIQFSNLYDTTIPVALTTPTTKHPLELIDKMLLVKAVFRGVAQVFLCPKFESGVLMLVGIGLCSPKLAAMGLYGSIIGTFTALAVGIDHKLVYAGLYGYNASLSAQAVGGVMYALNVKGFGFATFCAVISALSTPLFAESLAVVGTSPQTFPFCFGTALVVLLGNSVKGLKRQ
jgi:urea transporter